jgi:hypothetical protein
MPEGNRVCWPVASAPFDPDHCRQQFRQQSRRTETAAHGIADTATHPSTPVGARDKLQPMPQRAAPGEPVTDTELTLRHEYRSATVRSLCVTVWSVLV